MKNPILAPPATNSAACGKVATSLAKAEPQGRKPGLSSQSLLFWALLFLGLVALPTHAWAAPRALPQQQTIPAPVLTVTQTGNGTVTVDPLPPYALDQIVTLTVKADFGWRFEGWTGDLSGTANPIQLQLDGDKSVTANFVPQPVSTLTSDDFNNCTVDSSRWTFVNPRGDAEVTANGEQLQLFVPSGSNHDLWVSGKMAPRFMQTANDVDFQVEVKFESPLKRRIQMQGLLVEQDEDDFLRVNFQHDGVATRIFAATFITGTPTIKVNEVVSVTAPAYLRLLRMGDTWSISYSSDGLSWITNGLLTFEHELAVSKAGFFFGNAARNPAHTGIIDYFFNTAAPITPEDAVLRTLPLNVVGEGRVDKSCTNPITLTAKPNLGWNFAGWSGSLSGVTNPATIVLTGSEVVTATFVPKPFALNVTVSGGGEVLSTPGQDYFDSGDQVTLTAVPANGWAFVGWGGDLTGSETTVNLTMTSSKNVTAFFTLVNDSSGISSDDFNRCTLAGAAWEFVNPLNDAVLTMNGEQAQIFLPAGNNHDIWTSGNRAPRLMQPTANQDFQLEAKFDAPMQKRFQSQGIVVEADAGNLIRFNFQHDGTDLRIFAASFVANVPTVHVNQVIADSSPLYLRVLRAGDSWSLLYATDGSNWQTASAFNFTHPMVVQKVGVFVGNSGANPLHTALIDYFFNSLSPIVAEDSDVLTIDATVEGSGTVAKTPEQAIYRCGDEVELQATAAPNWVFTGWSGAVVTTTNPLPLTVAGDNVINANFKPLFNLSITPTGNGTVTPNTSQFVQGETVTLTALPATGWLFKQWSGDASGSANPLTITIDDHKSIIAVFEVKPAEPEDPPTSRLIFLPNVSR